MGVSAHRRAATAAVVLAGAIAGPAQADYKPGIPPAVDPGTPVFTGSEQPVPPEPAALDPGKSRLEAIYEADLAAGGTSFWMDRVLERPFLSNQDSYLYTRGRALYMYNHNAGVLGFGNGYAYRERPTGANQALFTVIVPGVTFTETTAERRQYPSHWRSTHTATGLSIGQRKFITHNNVAVAILRVTNTDTSPTTRSFTVASPVATTPAALGTELTGAVTARYGLTTITPRLSAEGFAVSGTSLTRELTLQPGESTTFKVVMGMTTREIADSDPEYERYRNDDAETAFRTHLREYNRWWVDNVPYVDVPDVNVKKMSYYRTFLNRYNHVDANIPGNDFQFPVSIEGVLGYNNAIQLTQPMHMQDLKYFRDPLWSYGDWVSSGETSKCTAFTDNPGNTANWNNTYEQYIAREAWQAYKVHGGNKAILENFAHYAECDIKGQLAKYDSNDNGLIAYDWGALTGNDADAVALAFYNSAPQERTETAFWYSGARAAAEAYALIGRHKKADELNAIADRIRTAILTLLWDDGPVDGGGGGPVAVGRVPGKFGNAVRLGDVAQYATLPDGLATGIDDFTVSVWLNPVANATWSRVFDFGTGTTQNMFLTINAGGAGVRYAITTGGGGAEQRVTYNGSLPLNEWSHVAVTLSGTTGRLYINGAPVATNENMTLKPSSLAATTRNWIGRSQYGDPGLNAIVDDFQLYDRALSAEEITALQTTRGAGNVASYRFDEESGNTGFDSSPHARNATFSTLVFRNEGKVFKQRDIARDALVPWKDQQNFSPFTEGVVPNTENYKLALRYYADKAEFPIMPSYTANQRDKEDAEASGRGGSNNFSNINSTLQAQLYSRAIREYPSQYITPDMLRKLLEWVTFTEYVNGDNRYPDNNEFFFNYDDETKTFGRSGIHHNILGAFNTMIFDDIVGIRPRLDEAVELWPIDVGWDHYAVNNLSYHGADMTITFDRAGDGRSYYPVEGMSLYVNGRRVLTVDDTARVSWNSATGEGRVLDGSDASIRFARAESLRQAPEVDLSGNARVADMFQKAGVDLSPAGPYLQNLAKGRPVSASFTTTSPSLVATAPEHAVDGFTISGLPIQIGSYVARNPIWGTQGSPNAQDWLEVDLGSVRPVDNVKLYFYSNKAFGVQGNTYREPSEYTIQFHDGSAWRDVPGQVRSPAAPAANYNRVDFPDVMTRRLRVLVTRSGTFGVGIKELQVFHTGSVTQVPGDVGGTVPATLSLTLGPPAQFGAFTPGVEREYSASTTANVVSTAGDAVLSVADPSANHTGHLVNGSFYLPQPLRARALNAATTGTAFNAVGSSLNLLAYDGPISNDAVTLQFRQAIGAGDALRTGRYGKTLTFTLSTTSP